MHVYVYKYKYIYIYVVLGYMLYPHEGPGDSAIRFPLWTRSRQARNLLCRLPTSEAQAGLLQKSMFRGVSLSKLGGGQGNLC